MTEKEILKGLRRDHAATYALVFEKYYKWLCNYVFGLCGDKGLAEDLVQNTMIRFWENRKKIAIKTSLKSYLFKSCHNEFLQHIRKKKMEISFLDQVRWDVIASTYEEHAEPDQPRVEILKRLINQLPPRCKEVFILNKLESKKYKEIAVDLGISEKTVEKHMSKALRYLKEQAAAFLL